MPGFISTLDERTHDRVLAAWEALRLNFGADPGPIHRPHLTYHLARRYDLRAAGEAARRIAGDTAPLEARGRGLGVFRNPRASVVYVPIEPNAALLALQVSVREAVTPGAEGEGAHFGPGRWTPHLSLAILEGDGWPVDEIVAFLGAADRPWSVRIEDLVLMRDAGGERGDWVRHPLGGRRAQAEPRAAATELPRRLGRSVGVPDGAADRTRR